MNRNIILKDDRGGSGAPKSDLTVASVNRDVRVVEETERKAPLKRKFSSRSSSKGSMAKEAKANARPVRKVKLNRSIFNSNFLENPVFRVKMLHEIKQEKQTAEGPLGKTNVKEAIVNTNISTDSAVTTIAEPAVPISAVSVDTRKVVKLNPLQKLMLPDIQLTRISSGKYTRSITNTETSKKPRKILSKEGLRRFKAEKAKLNNAKDQEVKQQPEGSPSKMRKISPVRSPKTQWIRSPEPQFEYQAADVSWSTSVVPLGVSPEQPASPPLSLGAQSDSELDDDAGPEWQPDARVVINTANEPTENRKSAQFKSPPPQWNFQLPTIGLNVISGDVDNDKLDMMSIMADDDELFADTRPTLKRSLSQDSVFGNQAEKTDTCGDLRSLLVKTSNGGAGVKKSVGDLIVSRPVPKNYRIPLANQNNERTPFAGGRNQFHHETSTNSAGWWLLGGSQRQVAGNAYGKNMAFQGSGGIPQGERREVPQFQEEMVRKVRLELKRGNIRDAWMLIKELDEAKCISDVRLLEEMLKVCEKASQTVCTLEVANVALGAFEMIKRLQREVKPTDFIMVILSLCRCRRFNEAFDKYRAMKAERKLPHEGTLELFINDLCKCLVFVPGQLIDILQDLKTLSLTMRRKTNVMNSCVASLISCNPAKIREVGLEKWNSLLTMLCSPPLMFVQSALQVYNIMEKNAVPLSPATVFPLFKVTEELKATKSLLKLICSRATRDVLLQHKPPVDVAQILSSPNIKVRQVEDCLFSLLKEGTMPDEDTLNHFLTKAMLVKEYSVIYQFFLKCRSLPMSLSMPALKQIMEALENWDENPNASVEVYTALRLAKKGPKHHTTPQVVNKEEAFRSTNRSAPGSYKHKGLCYQFANTGTCPMGDRCKFAHPKNPNNKDNQITSCGSKEEQSIGSKSDKKQAQFGMRSMSIHSNLPGVAKPSMNGPKLNGPSSNNCFQFQRSGFCRKGSTCPFLHSRDNAPQFSGHNSESRPRERVGDYQSTESDQKSAPLGSKTAFTSGPGVVNKTMVNGMIHFPLQRTVSFPSFQVRGPSLINQAFSPPLFNNLSGNRPRFMPRFQRIIGNPMTTPTLRVPGGNPVQPRDLDKPHPQDPGKQHPQPSLNQHSPSFVTSKPKVGRSFSWEPQSNGIKSNLHNGWKAHESPQISPDSANDNNNSGKGLAELPHRVDVAIRGKDWQAVYAYYIECKGISMQNVKSKDLQVFRNAFVKSPGGFGHNFGAFVKFLYKESCSDGSSHSSQSLQECFDVYDIDFIGSLGVSLMEKCLVLKQFEEGYEVLLCLHSHNISYFESGKNFGAYTKNIPPQHVALIAVKLCLGFGHSGSLGAMEVLRACNYALTEDAEVTTQDKEYRIKVLHQLYIHLFDEGHVVESFEVIQNLNAGTSVEGPMYLQVLNHFITADDFNQSFIILDKMQEKGLDLNCPPCHLLYEKYLKHCIAMRDYNQASNALEGMESSGIAMDGGVLRDILNTMSSAEQEPLANLLFEKCVNLNIYPKTFSPKMPWLCELGCGYSQQELKLLIRKHLEQLHGYLLSVFTSEQLITAVKHLQVVIIPRLPGFDTGTKITNGIPASLKSSGDVLISVLQQQFNPPLAVLEQTGEQFHRKIILEKMSVYRWFNANTPSSRMQHQPVDDHEGYESLSEGSVASDCLDC